jgi:putative ABC transport system permease protein
MIYVRLAWRNLWRNKRRTSITVGSMFFAVLLAIVMYAILEGVYGNMIRNMAGFTTGYLQVHSKGYWEDKNLDGAMHYNDAMVEQLEAIKGISTAMPRVESFALASTGISSSPAILMGIDVAREDRVNHLGERTLQGNLLAAGDAAVMIGAGLADKMHLQIGDTLLLLGQGYHAASAYGKYPVAAIVEIGNPELSKSMVYLPLQEIQRMLSLDGMVTSIALMSEPGADIDKLREMVTKAVDTAQYDVMDWTAMMPELLQTMEGDAAGNKIMIFILYMIIGFGLFSTVLMMLTERQHELGIMVAVGTGKRQLAWMVFLEVMLLAVIGIALGTLASLPILHYLDRNPIRLTGDVAEIYASYGFEPIMPVLITPEIFLSQVRIVGFIALLVSLYPTIKLLRFSVMKAIRS